MLSDFFAVLEDWIYVIICVLIGANVALFIVIFFVNYNFREPVIEKNKNLHLLSVIGSGGHTYEMLKLLDGLEKIFSKKTYVIAITDTKSQQQVIEFEKKQNEIINSTNDKTNEFEIKFIPRSREVKQSYFTAIWTTLYASYYSFKIFNETKPDVILCNGPGTGLPLCLIGALFSILRISNTRIIYVESVCRVKTLSLTALILYYTKTADLIFVHWLSLHKRYPKTKYIGRLF